MINKHIQSIAVCLIFLLAFSCGKEPVDPGSRSGKKWSPMFSSLMEICLGGHYFCGATSSEECVTFSFSENNVVSLPRDEVKIIDCTIFDEPVFAEQDGVWTINLVKTPFKVDRNLPMQESQPICVYYDEHCISVFFSNGSKFVVGKDPTGSLSSFAFYTKENTLLKKSILCEIDGFSVKGSAPKDMATMKLIPRFEFTGKRITVSGEEQVSGVTKQNFASPVTYDIELYDGKTVSYTVELSSSSDFPTVYINTKNHAQILKDTYVTGTIRIEDPKKKYSDVAYLESDMKIKGRGNATWNNFPKKPYRIKLDEKSKVFGLPKNKDWVLLANYSDKTLLRNEVAMEISKICGMSWTPVFYPVEVYLNGKYDGCYDFGDHKEVASHRVEIDIVTEQDNSGDAVTGGYYFEIEQQLDEPVSWMTSMGVPMMFKDPENPTGAQQNYVRGYFNEFERVLQSASFADPVNGYAKYIDVPSFVNYYIIQELTKNIDGNLRKSSFLTKERGGKLEMYHVWDFDFTLGNCDYFDDYYGLSNGPSDFFIKDVGYQGHGSGWFYRLFKDPAFKQKVKQRWNEVKPELKTKIPEFIDSQSAYIENAADRNFERWDILHTYVWPNPVIPGTYRGEVQYMKEFYMNRLQWLDTEINKW